MAIYAQTGINPQVLNCSNLLSAFQTAFQRTNGKHDVLNANSNNSDVAQTNEDGYYYENIDDLAKPGVAEQHFLALVLLYGTVFLLGVTGNGMAILVICGAKFRRSVTFNFMASLAVADMLFLLVVVPHEVLRMVLGDWSGGRILCKVSGFVEMLTEVASIANLTAISFERYFVIVMPIRSRSNCTLGRRRRILVAVWVLAIVLASPAFYTRDTELTTYYNNDSRVTLIVCADNASQGDNMLYYFSYELLIMFVLPTCLMVYCYSVVIYVLCISNRRLLNMTSNNRNRLPVSNRSPSSSSDISSPKPKLPHNSARRNNGDRLQVQDPLCNGRTRLVCYTTNWPPPVPDSPNCTPTGRRQAMRDKALRPACSHAVCVNVLKERKQVIKMLITVIILFLLCWGPKFLFQIIKHVDHTTMLTGPFFEAQIWIQCLPYIHSCLNPIIYGLMSKNFRRSFKLFWNGHRRRLCGWCCRRSQTAEEFDMKRRYSTGTVLTKSATRDL